MPPPPPPILLLPSFIPRCVSMSVCLVMNQFIQKLDNRYNKTKKPGAGSTVKRERVGGTPSSTSPFVSLPPWMIDGNYKPVLTSDISSVCIQESSLDRPEDHASVVSIEGKSSKYSSQPASTQRDVVQCVSP